MMTPDFEHPSLKFKDFPEGSTKSLDTIDDILVGSTIVGSRSYGQITKSMEYTVTAVQPNRVEFTAKGKKYILPMGILVQCCKRRVGRVMPSSIKKGLTVIATLNGNGYSKGDILTLTASMSRGYEYRTSTGSTGHIDSSIIPLSFLYV